MTPSQPRTDPSFEALLEYLKRNRSFDFTGYKRSTLMRRVEKRMRAVDVETYGEYTDFLEVHPDEFAQLFNTILINVTSFYRDLDAWQALSAELVRRFGGDGGPVRVWSAGCASGEETYTLVMALCEALGVDAFRERVKVYATDVDNAALGEARAAVYDEKALAELPEGSRSGTSSRWRASSSSATTCGASSSSAGTTWCRTRPSRTWTCSSAATR